MAAFRFRLEPVRRLREARRDELRGQLADAYRAAEIVREQQQQVLTEVQQLRQRETELTAEPNLRVNSLIEHQRYELVLKGQAAALQQKLKLVEQEVERRRALVAEADREVRTLDKLEDRQRAAKLREDTRADAKQMDETALQMLAVRQASAAAGGESR